MYETSEVRVDEAKRLKELEKENTRLKKLVADVSLDNAILDRGSGEIPEPSQRKLTPDLRFDIVREVIAEKDNNPREGRFRY
jgi:hypothetical protein